MSFRHWFCNIRSIDFRSSWVSPLSWPALLTNTPRAPPSETGKWIPSLKDWWTKYLDQGIQSAGEQKIHRLNRQIFYLGMCININIFFNISPLAWIILWHFYNPVTLLLCFKLSFLLKKSMFNSCIGTGYCPFEENLKGNLYFFV